MKNNEHLSHFQLNDIVLHDYDEVYRLADSQDQVSVFEDFEDFQVFVVRRMSVHKNALSFESAPFILKPGKVYYYQREKGCWKLLKNSFEEMSELLDRFYAENQKILYSYVSEIEKLEDFLFERKIPSYFMDLWFDIKKDLTRVDNFYYRNSIVYREFLKKTHQSIESFIDDFKDIEENIQFHISYIASLKIRLDSLHHYYSSIHYDRLNKTLMRLTVISAIFLPLNLIVGFFGINTAGLFFQNDPQGTQKVLIILFTVLLLALLGMRLIKWLDHYMLRFFLGRYDFYKNISQRLKKL